MVLNLGKRFAFRGESAVPANHGVKQQDGVAMGPARPKECCLSSYWLKRAVDVAALRRASSRQRRRPSETLAVPSASCPAAP